MATKIVSNKPKPYVLLTVVQSESGAWEYEIRTSLRDGKTYCTCKGFTFHKTCKHMDAYRDNPVINVPVVVQQQKKPMTPGEQLQRELADLGHVIGLQPCIAIAGRIIAAAGKVMPTSTDDFDTINAANVRRIILPD